MTQEDFLAQKIFTGLTNENWNENDTNSYFSESDFAEVLRQTEHFGISVYEIKTFLNGVAFESVHHEKFKKKATDADWYKREFKYLKHKQEGLLYTASYKVSKKLLAR